MSEIADESSERIQRTTPSCKGSYRSLSKPSPPDLAHPHFVLRAPAACFQNALALNPLHFLTMQVRKERPKVHTLSRARGTSGWLTGGILAVAQHIQCSKSMPGRGACLNGETGCLLALSRSSHLGSPFCDDVWSMRSGRRGSSSAMIRAQAKRRRELCATLLRLSGMSLTSRGELECKMGWGIKTLQL